MEIKDKAEDIKDKAVDFADEAGDKIASASQKAAKAVHEKGKEWQDKTEDLAASCSYLRDYPVMSILIAGASGFLLRSLLTGLQSSRRW